MRLNFQLSKKRAWSLALIATITFVVFVWLLKDILLVTSVRLNSSSLVYALLVFKANPNKHYGLYENTPLMYAAQNGQARIIEMLLKGGADSEAKNKEGLTALMFAAARECISCAEILLSKGSDINQKNLTQSTALRYAVMNRHLEMSRLLIDKGADVNVKTTNGDTALMRASQCECAEITILLLKNNADPFIINDKGKTAFTIAVESGNQKAATILEGYMKRTSVNVSAVGPNMIRNYRTNFRGVVALRNTAVLLPHDSLKPAPYKSLCSGCSSALTSLAQSAAPRLRPVDE